MLTILRATQLINSRSQDSNPDLSLESKYWAIVSYCISRVRSTSTQFLPTSSSLSRRGSGCVTTIKYTRSMVMEDGKWVNLIELVYCPLPCPLSSPTPPGATEGNWVHFHLPLLPPNFSQFIHICVSSCLPFPQQTRLITREEGLPCLTCMYLRGLLNTAFSLALFISFST